MKDLNTLKAEAKKLSEEAAEIRGSITRLTQERAEIVAALQKEGIDDPATLDDHIARLEAEIVAEIADTKAKVEAAWKILRA